MTKYTLENNSLGLPVQEYISRWYEWGYANGRDDIDKQPFQFDSPSNGHPDEIWDAWKMGLKDGEGDKSLDK